MVNTSKYLQFLNTFIFEFGSENSSTQFAATDDYRADRDQDLTM